MNWGIIGHEWAVGMLQAHLQQERLRHAYLFSGPPGVGRRTLALRLAQAINCQNPPAPAQACGTCRACRLTERMQHPDLSIVQSEQVGAALKIEQVRELLHSLALAPYEARYRIALLLRFDEATTATANALLKTLEEPPPSVILLLTAENPESLEPTIVSRCEVLRLRAIPAEQVAAGLVEKWGAAPEQAHLLAHLSGGRLGYAVTLLQQPDLLEQRQDWLEDLQRLLAANRPERFKFAEKTADKLRGKNPEESARERARLRQRLHTWLSFWRDVLMVVYDRPAVIRNLDWEPAIRSLGARLSAAQVLQFVAALQRSEEDFDRYVNPRLLLEVLMLDLP